MANLETKIRNNKQQIEYESKRRQELLSEYHEFEAKEEEVGARQFQPSTDNVCSCCGQALPPEQVEEVNKKHWPTLINRSPKI